MEKFVQEFRTAVRGSRYEERPLVKEFKRGMSGAIRRKLMKAERSPISIEQWYECATNLDRHWMLWNALDTNIFLFLLSIFLDFIFLFF